MPRLLERKSRKFILHGMDWQVPEDFHGVTGVLVARLDKGVFAVYRDGRWNPHKVIDWQLKYDTVLPAGLSVGGWGIIPHLTHLLGTYKETFTRDSLSKAFDRARTEMMSLVTYKPSVARGLNKDNKPTVAV